MAVQSLGQMGKGKGREKAGSIETGARTAGFGATLPSSGGCGKSRGRRWAGFNPLGSEISGQARLYSIPQVFLPHTLLEKEDYY